MERTQRDHLLEDLQSGDEDVRRLAVERLTTLPPAEGIPALVQCLGDPSWRVRKAAIERLASAPQNAGAVSALIESLADGDNPGRRNAALEALTRCGSAAVPALLEASHDPDIDVRKQIVDALSAIADPVAGPRLLALLDDPDPNVRGAAAEGLGCLGDASAGDPLLALAVRDAETLVRLSTLRALDRLEFEVSPSELQWALDDPLLCGAAYALLAHADGALAVPVLLKGLESGGPSARDAVVQALVRICARESGTRPELLEEIQQGIPREGPAFAYAMERARDGSLAARLAVVQLLGMVRHAEAGVALLAAACDEALTEVALDALRALGAPAVPPIEAAWHAIGSESRTVACRFLAETPGDASRALLVQALRGGDFEVRAEAARALGAHRAIENVPELVDLVSQATGGDEPWRDEEQRAAGIDALSEIGGDAPAVVIDALRLRIGEESDGFRLAAASILQRIGRPEDASLLGLLASDASPAVRRAAVEGLATISAEPPVETLRMALADEDAGVRIGAATALSRCAPDRVLDDLASLAEDPDDRVRAAALRSLGRLCGRGSADPQPRVLNLLSQALHRRGTPAMAALEVLSEIGGESAVALASSVLEAPDAELVEAAVACIGRHAPRESLCELLPLLSHDQWVVRAQTVDVLAERSVQAAVPAMLRRLEAEPDDFVRDAILSALDRLE